MFGSPFPLTPRLSHFSINEIVFFVYFPSNLNLNVGSETKIVVFYNECRAQNRRKIVLQGKISAQKSNSSTMGVQWRQGESGWWQRLWFCVEFEKEDGTGWDVWSGWWWDSEVLGGC